MEAVENSINLESADYYEVINFTQFEDEDDIVYMTVYSFMAQRYSFWERLQFLFGGKVKSCGIVLTTEEFNKLRDWVEQLDKQPKVKSVVKVKEKDYANIYTLW